MTKTKTSIIGFLIAPLVSASIGISQTDTFGGLDIQTYFGLLPIFYLFSALATVIFGVPIFLLLNRYRFIRWWSTTGFGMLIGAIVMVVFVFPNAVELKGLVTMVLMGGVSAFSFWAIWRLGK